MRKHLYFSFVLVLAFSLALLAAVQEKKKDMQEMGKKEMTKEMMGDATVIKLDQTPGMFEPTELKLKPGKYIFKVTNVSVDHEVAFVLNKAKKDNTPGEKVPNAELPKTLKKGETASTPVVELKPGRYLYQCPLNPTPHYVITVQ